jgi:hypothetical protein
MADYSDPLGLLFGSMDWMNPEQKSQGLLQITPQEIERMVAAQSPAFGVFPQMQPYRSKQDITASANVPVDVARGRVAGTLGLFGDVFNQPIPMVRPLQLLSQAMTGQQKYPDTEYFLNTLPLKSDTPVGDVAGRIGSFAPINPMPAVRGVQKLGGLLGEEMATRLNTGRPILPSLLAEPQTAMFAVNPAEQAMTSGLLQAEVSPLGFYSAVEQQALKIPRKQGTGESFLNDLLKGQDVKKYEIEAMGLDTYLKGKPNVTRQEVQDFIANNRVDVQEVMRSDALPPAEPYYLDTQRLNTLESEFKQLKQHPIDDPSFGQEKFDELMKLQNIRDESTVESLYNSAESATRQAQRAQAQGRKDIAEKYFREAEMFNTRAEALDLRKLGIQAQEPIAPTRYSNYQLAGGENYRELVLTLPENMSEYNKYVKTLRDKYGQGGFDNLPLTDIERARLDKFYAAEELDPYKSSHFPDIANPLAHLRVNDRIDAEGKKMLLIEEVQSDWHQAGRERGYGPKIERIVEAYYETKDGQRVPIGYGRTKEEAEANIDVGWKNTVDIKYETSDRKVGEGVPDAPFKDTWYQLALKRAIKEAVDKGYDRIGLTTGKQQAARYDLSKQVDELNYKRNDDGTYQLSAQANGRGNMLGETVSEEKLSDYVGKEVAEKIIKNEGFDRNFGGTGSVSQPKDIWKGLSGLDLKVGGEGMKKYYDEIYPNFLNKYGKKYGAQVGETEIGLPQKTSSSWAYFRDWFAENHSDVGSSATALSNWEKGSNNKYVKEFEKFRKTPTQKETVRYLDITPEMRKAVQKGQPLAAVEGMTGLLA